MRQAAIRGIAGAVEGIVTGLLRRESGSASQKTQRSLASAPSPEPKAGVPPVTGPLPSSRSEQSWPGGMRACVTPLISGERPATAEGSVPAPAPVSVMGARQLRMSSRIDSSVGDYGACFAAGPIAAAPCRRLGDSDDAGDLRVQARDVAGGAAR